MATTRTQTTTIPLAIGILSLALIAYELTLIQIFSFLQWYHFAYMIIAIALLGFGVAGTMITLWQSWLVKNFDHIFTALFFGCGITMPIAIFLINLPLFRFDTFLIFSDFSQIIKLLLTYLIVFIPFLCGALAIGLTFVKFIDRIGHLYFSNLVGSGLGGLCFLQLIEISSPTQISTMISALAIGAGWIVMYSLKHRPIRILGILSILITSYFIWSPPRLINSQFKSISSTLLLPDSKIYLEKPSAFGIIQVVQSPHLRYAPGISLNYQEDITVSDALFINGDWLGAIIPFADQKEPLLDHTTSGLPYYLDPPEKILFLEAGCGEGIGQSFYHQAKEVTVVEANPAVTQLFLNELASISDSLFFHPSLRIVNQDSRNYLLSDTSRFSLIVLPPVNAFGGLSGLNATQENHLLTKDAVGDLWKRLLPSGIASITTWLDYPVRDPLKLLTMFTEGLTNLNIEDPRKHIVAIKNWGTITFLIKKSPFLSSESEKIRNFCQKNLFDPVLLPDLEIHERDQFNTLQDTLFYTYIDSVLSPSRANFYANYDFNIRPATDNNPYFYQNLRWQSISKLVDLYGWSGLGFMETGFLLVYLTLLQIVIIAMVFIIIPLLRKKLERRNILSTLFYFSGLGLGYLFIEIVLIQQFIFYLGQAIYATAMVITIMLITSGLGSYYSSYLTIKLPTLRKWPLWIIIITLIYAFLLSSILKSTISAPFPVKIIVMVLLAGVPGFCMGIPFPLGMSFLNQVRQRSVPWAWGINGYFSVISSPLATIIAVELGYAQLLLFATFAYTVVLMASYGWKHL